MKKTEIKDEVLKKGKITVTRTTQGTGPDGKGVVLDATNKPLVVDVPKDITIASAVELVVLGKAELGNTTKKEDKKS